MALPAPTLTFVVLAHMMRMTRAAILNVMQSAYIETAELKGLRPFDIIRRHALPNAIAPIINVVMLNLAYLVVGVVVVEVIFVYPGMGQFMVDHVAKRDVPVVQACGLIFAAIYILLNIIADIVGSSPIRGCGIRNRRRDARAAIHVQRLDRPRRAPALFVARRAVFAPLIAPYRRGRGRRRRLGAGVGEICSAPTISAATCCRA